MIGYLCFYSSEPRAERCSDTCGCPMVHSSPANAINEARAKAIEDVRKAIEKYSETAERSHVREACIDVLDHFNKIVKGLKYG